MQATVQETEQALAPDPALLLAAAQAQATDAAPGVSPVSPFKVAAGTMAQELSRQKSRVERPRLRRLPTV